MYLDITAVRARFNSIRDIPHNPLPNEEPHAGSAGRLIEHLFGVEENNLQGPDYYQWEFKSKRKSAANADSLFTLKPSFPPKGDTYMREEWGIADPPRTDGKDTFPHHKILNTSLFANRYNPVFQKFGHPDGKWIMQLIVDRDSEKVRITVSRTSGELFDDSVYWTFKHLRSALENKLTNQIAFTVQETLSLGRLQYVFTGATAYAGVQWESFLSGIENQNIQYDNRLGIYRSGKSYGKLHNHGGAFRLASGKRNFLRTLYETYEEL